MTGHTEQLEHDRVQMMGQSELGYLWSQPPEARHVILRALARADFPALVVTAGLEPPPELLAVGDDHAGGVRISIGDPPRRKRATIFGAFVRDA